MAQSSNISIAVHAAPSKSLGRDPRKQTLYVDPAVVAQMKAEGRRIDRGISWMVREAWRLAYEQIRAMPSAGRH